MFTPSAHIIIIDGEKNSGRNMLCFELALLLLYNAQRTAIALTPDSPLHEVIKKRRIIMPQLLTPDIINLSDFYASANKYQAVIIPETSFQSELSVLASTYITLLPKNKPSLNRFQKKQYANHIFDLKKKIAATYNHSLNWIVCENNLKPAIVDSPSAELQKLAAVSGFRAAPPLNYRKAYKNNINGISAQDKSLPILQKDLTYEDICAKREITKLAEFIFS